MHQPGFDMVVEYPYQEEDSPVTLEVNYDLDALTVRPLQRIRDGEYDCKEIKRHLKRV